MGCPEWRDELIAPERLDAAYHSLAAAANVGIRSTDLEKWHGKLFAGRVPVSYYAGHIRRGNDFKRPCLALDVVVGGVLGSRFEDVPAHMQELNRALSELDQLKLTWTGSTADLFAFANRLSFCVGQFIRIHPFINGNGRVSRMLWDWGLLRYAIAPQVALSPRPPQPYSSIMEACMLGDDLPLAKAIVLHLASFG